MNSERPDLSQVSPEILHYIDSLESEIARLRSAIEAGTTDQMDAFEDENPEPPEPPTTIHLMAITRKGIVKRTPRHLYTRQRRGGMGVFDMEVPANDALQTIVFADESQNLILLTSLARAFRMPVNLLTQTPVRAKGTPVTERLPLQDNEQFVAALPEQAQGYIALLCSSGYVKLLRHHIFGEHMKPGMGLLDTRHMGPLVSACWTPGNSDLFIASIQGKAIRFSEKLVPPQGGPGIRLTEGDQAVAVTSVYPDSGVFLLSEDGKGTIRTMEGFAANKAPGAGGKNAIATDKLITAFTVSDTDDIFIITQLSKIIRFKAAEIPPKDGVVQGVVCMSLRGDEIVAATPTQMIQYPF